MMASSFYAEKSDLLRRLDKLVSVGVQEARVLAVCDGGGRAYIEAVVNGAIVHYRINTMCHKGSFYANFEAGVLFDILKGMLDRIEVVLIRASVDDGRLEVYGLERILPPARLVGNPIFVGEGYASHLNEVEW